MSRAWCACMCAAIRFMTSATSVMRVPKSRSISCGVTWSTAAISVNFVRNITDIDDKIIKRAAENGESIQSLTERFTAAMHEDYDRLGILRPTHEPKATEHIPGIIAMTQQLIDKGYAYVASNGDVLYSVSKFAGYGKLSGRDVGRSARRRPRRGR